jgi:hypothetical protein
VSGRQPRVAVEIDELVLHGFDVKQRRAIAEAVEAELVTALAGWRPEAGDTARLDAGSFPVAAAARPGDVGRALGQQVGRALRGEAPAGRQSARRAGAPRAPGPRPGREESR